MASATQRYQQPIMAGAPINGAVNLMPEAHIHRYSTLPTKSAVTEKALAVRIAVGAGNFAEADRIMQDALSESRVVGFAFLPFDEVVYQLQPKGALPAFIGLDNWVTSDKASPFPYLARAQFLIQTGWATRGNGFVNDTPAQSMKFFETNLNNAMADLVQSIKLNNAIPTSFERLLEVMRALGADEITYSTIFDEAVKKWPDCYPLFKERFRRLTSKWGGSITQLHTFVDDTLKHVSGDSPLRLLQQDLYFSLFLDMKANCGGNGDGVAACQKAVDELLTSKEMENTYKDATGSLERAHPVEFNNIMMNTYSSDFLVASPYTKHALDWEREVLGENNYAVDFGYGHYYYSGMHSHEDAFRYYNKALSEVEAYSFSNEDDKKVALAKIYGVMADETFEEGNFEEAVGFADKSIAQDNTVPLYYTQRCQAYFKLKKYEMALKDCNEALSLGAPSGVFQLLHDISVALTTHTQHTP